MLARDSDSVTDDLDLPSRLAIAGSSMLDEATAAAEAMTLALRVGKSKSLKFFVADDVLPQTLEVVRTRARPIGVEVITGPAEQAGAAEAFAVLDQPALRPLPMWKLE